MEEIGQEVPPQNHAMPHAQRPGGLNILHLAQFERFGAEQATESGPGRKPQNQTQGEQPKIGAGRKAGEVSLMPGHIGLHHQHGGGNQ